MCVSEKAVLAVASKQQRGGHTKQAGGSSTLAQHTPSGIQETPLIISDSRCLKCSGCTLIRPVITPRTTRSASRPHKVSELSSQTQ